MMLERANAADAHDWTSFGGGVLMACGQPTASTAAFSSSTSRSDCGSLSPRYARDASSSVISSASSRNRRVALSGFSYGSGHWKNLAPHGLAWPIYILLIPIEIMGMFVRPFALTMRLAANMTGGHIAILAILSFVFLFAEMFGRAAAGIGVGLMVSVPLAVGISALEIIVVLVQAYVFTLLTAVFIGMAIHVHH